MPFVDTIGDVSEVVLFVLARLLLFDEVELLLLLAPFEDIRETRAELTSDALFNCKLFDCCFTDD
mgnify:CR=1 FL=1